MSRWLLVTAVVGLACGALPSLRLAPANGPTGVRFVDITDVSGVHFKHVSAPEKKYIVESMSGGVALFDYDNDGCLDIYFTNALTVETANDPKARAARCTTVTAMGRLRT